MAKAIILTYADITEEEKELLKNTDVFKIACNNYCAELKPNIRLCADDIVDKCLNCDSCPVISINYDRDKKGVIDGHYLPNRNSSLILCLDYLIYKRYDSVLLVANNQMSNNRDIKADFQNYNRKCVNELKPYINMYKYSENGVFDIPHLKIKEFLTMKEELMPITDEEKLLGATAPRKKTLLEIHAFNENCRYEVWTEGKNNKSIESGLVIGSILPPEKKHLILNGETELNYNGLCVKMLTELREKKEEKDIEKMSYKEMLAYCKENNIKLSSTKKDDVIKAIKGMK
ncbi:MAG: hypothetical protein MJ180_00215 [Candidatus Gastranaerophilales bacterium]|nr:hypothetical protein [Candidatus Gastranaerophilales bacterium]